MSLDFQDVREQHLLADYINNAPTPTQGTAVIPVNVTNGVLPPLPRENRRQLREQRQQK